MLHSIFQGTEVGDGECTGNVFPPFRFNSSAVHLPQMVLFAHSSREMAEQRGSFFYTLCYLGSLRNVAGFNGCITQHVCVPACTRGRGAGGAEPAGKPAR